jgi:hypothetical protein
MPLSQPEQTIRTVVDEIKELRKRRPKSSPATQVRGTRRTVDPQLAEIAKRYNIRLSDIGR